MLSANFGQLDKDVELVNEGAADWFHLDIMDGVFVPNISYGFPVVKAMAKKAKSIVTLSIPKCRKRLYSILFFI